MTSLIIESSISSNISIALMQKNKILTEINKKQTQNYKIEIIELISQAIKKAKIEKKSIKLLIVDIGPGSFTGLRNGISTARAICQINKIPIIGINSLLVLKENIKKHKKINKIKNKIIVTMLKSTKNKAYISIFKSNDEKQILNKNKIDQITLDKLIEKLKKYQSQIVLIGNTNWHIKIKSSLKNKIYEIKNSIPKAKYLGQIAYKLYTQNIKEKYNQIKPLYMHSFKKTDN